MEAVTRSEHERKEHNPASRFAYDVIISPNFSHILINAPK